MKKTLLVTAFFLACFSMQAQENNIIYTLFEPDTCFSLHSYDDTVFWDLNQDGVSDLFFYLTFFSTGDITNFGPKPGWKYCNVLGPNQPVADTTLIDESLNWYSGECYLTIYDEPRWWHFAFRHQADDGIHYGWAHLKCGGYRKVSFSGMGYCTVPNQPIQWGQTELLSVDEADFTGFATVQPNPTTGMVSIKGDGIQRIEVYDLQGQQVLNRQLDNDNLTIDLSGQPAGVYLINITNKEGRRCVKKVVKQ